MRTLYNGFGFEEIRRGVTFMDGSFTTRYATGIVRPDAERDDGMRYRWLGGEGSSGVRTRNPEDGESAALPVRYTGISVTLYGNGEAVGINRSASAGSRGGSVYLGKDILGSVRSASGEYGTLEGRYEYDAFGKPYKGEFGDGMNLGYTGKAYDVTTGMYNYGYRDYAPEGARFTTEDPIRDGANWFAYVNNDPVNFLDLWGLQCIGASDAKYRSLVPSSKEQNMLTAATFAESSPYGFYTEKEVAGIASVILNRTVEQYHGNKTVEAVITEPGQVNGIHTIEYSYAMSILDANSPLSEKEKSSLTLTDILFYDRKLSDIKNIIGGVLDGSIEDPTNQLGNGKGALFWGSQSDFDNAGGIFKDAREGHMGQVIKEGGTYFFRGVP
jgi:RHS repeat-associated protein